MAETAAAKKKRLAMKKVAEKAVEAKKSRKQEIIDELDANGIDFEEVREVPRLDASGVQVVEEGEPVFDYIEMSEKELSDLLVKSKKELASKHNDEEEKPQLKDLPKKGTKDSKEKTALPEGTKVIPVTHKEVMEIQRQAKLIGYYEKNGQAYAIIKK